MNHAHGSPYDRGSADSFYHRVPRPHYICDIRGERIEEHQMSVAQIAEYKAGYEDNHKQTDSRKGYA